MTSSGARPSVTHSAVISTSTHVLAARQVEHDVRQQLFENRAQAARAGAALERLLRDRAQRASSKVSFTSSSSNSLVYCFVSAFFGSLRMRTSDSSSSASSGTRHRQAADELGNQPEAEQVVRLDFGERVLRDCSACFLRRLALLKPICRRPVRASMIFSRPSNAPPQMNRMSFVLIWMYSCCGCLRPPCGGTEATVPSRILSSACCTPSPETSRVMLGFSRLARDLVDLVDVDDAALALGDVEVAGLEQPDENVLDVFADVAGFGQRGRVGDRERNVEDARQRLREQRLADAGGADEQDVRLVELDVVVARPTPS